MSRASLPKLDIYEGCDQREYKRIEEVAETTNGPVYCQMYIEDEGLKGILLNEPNWSFSEFKRDFEDEYCKNME